MILKVSYPQTVTVWDLGKYGLLEGDDPDRSLEQGKIILELDGKILKGGFSLVLMKGRGEKNWLLIKKKDKYSQEKWTLKKALTKEKEGSLKEKEPPCEVH
jgi:hypothetical protein